MRLRTFCWLPLGASILSLVACKDPELIPLDVVDTTPPTAVADLVVSDPQAESVLLTWSATGDDGDDGRADQYEVRFSRNSHAGDAWLSVDSVLQVEAPAGTGVAVSVRVGGLARGKSYYFAVRAADEVPNWSPFSSSAVSSTSNTPPVVSFSLEPDSTCYDTVTLDASATYDAEDSADELRFRWDWQSDGLWDTEWSAQRMATLPAELPSSSVRLQVLDTGNLTQDAIRQFHRHSGVQIRSAERRVNAQFYDGCCRPTRTGGCEGCWVNENVRTTALGLWSVWIHGRTQYSYVGVDSIWGSGQRGEGNYLRVTFDLCMETKVDVSHAGCSLTLTSITTGETIVQASYCRDVQQQLTLVPGTYFLSVQLTRQSSPFRLDFGRP